MPAPYSPNNPDTEVVQLRIKDSDVTLTRWVSYDFASEYLTPASAFHFVVADADLPARERDALTLGAGVRLTINSVPLCDGHIDTVEVSASRGAGTGWSIGGRERLGLAVDAIADPTLQIKESFTLEQTLRLLYAPFGWTTDEHFSIDNAASRGVTQGLRSTPMSRGGKRRPSRPLKDFVLHQCKPHNHEGVHDFAKRMTERHGLWIRCSEDGERIIVDTPNYEQDPSFVIRRSSSGGTNVLEGTVRYDFTNQPSMIVADGASGGGEFGRGRIKSFCVNPYFGVDSNGDVLPRLKEVLAKQPTAKEVTMRTEPFKRRTVNVPLRVVFLHDEESKTQAELDNFVRREMSLFMRRSLTAHFTVEGHGQIVNEQFVPWMVDTVVDIQDEVSGLEERMWIAGVAYSKSRQGGTATRLELIRLYSLQLGHADDAPSTKTKSVPKARNPIGFERLRDIKTFDRGSDGAGRNRRAAVDVIDKPDK